jgi:hypothetical protein
MSTLKARNIEPATGTDVALGASGDTVTVSGDSLTLDTFKDSGGNTLFTSNGSGTLSSVNSALKGYGPILISSQTASSSSTVEFTSGIDSTYDKYMFVFVNIHPGTDNADFTFQGSTNGGSSYGVTMTTTFFWSYHQESDANQGVEYHASSDQAQGTAYQKLIHEAGNDSDQCCVGNLMLYNPANTTYVKNFKSRLSNASRDDKAYDHFTSGYFNTTTAINAISFKMSSGNIDDGIIKMYGIA